MTHSLTLTFFQNSGSYMRTLANSEDADKMPHTVAFHQSIIFAKMKTTFRERNVILFGKITCDPSIYMMDDPNFIISNEKEESVCA